MILLVVDQYQMGWNNRSGTNRLNSTIILAVMKIQIAATTGADLNHLV